MKLIWKLLRHHISIPQFVGFFFANMFGMFIVLLAFQLYNDILPVFTRGDSFMKPGFIVVSKRIGTGNAISGRTNTFCQAELDDLAGQRFVRSIGRFTATSYRVHASMSVAGVDVLSSELFFESVPDAFIDVPLEKWKYVPGDKVVPIILPRSYLAMYNFGFAQSRSLPKISEGLASMIGFNLFVDSNGSSDRFLGNVIGFSGRLNSILVPQSFMDWSNARYSSGGDNPPTRIILDVNNPADRNMSIYMEKNGYDVSDNNLAAEKTTYFLRMLVFMVVAVGLIISALSFYMLMISVYLLIQKNSSKLENLLLIGYPPAKVAMPYQTLVVSLNFAVLVIVWILLFVVRSFYMYVLQDLFPEVGDGTVLYSVLLGVALFAFISVINVLIIRHKVEDIWERK